MTSLHDADEVIGRITNDGAWDRRYRIPHAQPEPIEVNWLVEAAKILGQAALFVVLFGSLIFTAAIFAVTQPAVTP
jgi:hypothetical protein